MRSFRTLALLTLLAFPAAAQFWGGGGGGSGSPWKFAAVPYSASPAINVKGATHFSLTLTGDASIAVSGFEAGKFVVITVCQDGAGYHNVTWPTSVLGARNVRPQGNVCTRQEFVSSATQLLYLNTALREDSANNASGDYAFLGEGISNSATGDFAFVGAGNSNLAAGRQSAITGGLANRADGESSSIGGGEANSTDADLSTVAGGRSNNARGEGVFIGGGDSNTAYGDQSVIGGGDSNSADGEYSVVGGGSSNSAREEYSVVGGGSSNTARRYATVVAGGESNYAGEDGSAISGGSSNATYGRYAYVPGGQSNMAEGEASGAAGISAYARLYGQSTLAAGQFSTGGDAQTSRLVARRSTADATPVPLALDGGSAPLTLVNNSVVTFRALIVARSGTDGAGWQITGVIKRDADTSSTAFIGTPAVTLFGRTVPTWDVSAAADASTGALSLIVTGEAGKTIHWVAAIELAEVQ